MVEGLDGLASGLATNQIIEQLMQLERRSLVDMQQQKSNLGKIQDAWREVNSKISGLDDMIGNLISEDTFLSKTVESSNEAVATATADTSAATGTYELNVTNLAQAHRVVSEKQSSSTDPLGYAADGDVSEFTITVDGTTETVTVYDDYSLSDVRDAINNNSENAQASIIDNQLVIESAETGTVNEMVLEDTSGTVLQDLGITDGTGNIVTSQVLQAPENAELTINDIQVTRSSNTISDLVEGVTFELSGEGQATIDIERDIQKATDTVQKFVDQYNKVQDFIDSKTGYDSDADEAGVLQGDNVLSRLESTLRSLVTDSVETTGKYDQLAMVGIEIDRYGDMTFDSTKFEEALKDNPDAVRKLFQADTESSDLFDGIATRLEDYLYEVIHSSSGVVPERIDFYDTRIDNIEEDIDNYEDRLVSVRERYVREFTAMEKAISEMQSQGQWLMSQLSGLSDMNSNLLNSL